MEEGASARAQNVGSQTVCPGTPARHRKPTGEPRVFQKILAKHRNSQYCWLLSAPPAQGSSQFHQIVPHSGFVVVVCFVLFCKAVFSEFALVKSGSCMKNQCITGVQSDSEVCEAVQPNR